MVLIDKKCYLILLSLLLGLSACNQSNRIEDVPNTPTTGMVSICAEHSFNYFLSAQMQTFESIYKNAKVIIHYKDEQAVIRDLLNDSCKVIFLNRKLSEAELKVFNQKNIYPIQTAIAKSAIVLIGKPFNKHGISTNELKNYLQNNSSYTFIFLRKQSGATLYFKDSILKIKNFAKHCFSFEDTAQFRQYITTHNNTIGVLDYALICDDDDKWTRELKYPLNDTLLIPIRKDTHTFAYYPDQSNIASGDYCFIRTIYCIRRSENFSLGAGIEAFIAGEKGQLLFKKMGFVPIYQRERRVQFSPIP